MAVGHTNGSALNFGLDGTAFAFEGESHDVICCLISVVVGYERQDEERREEMLIHDEFQRI